jgi:hypothetical protein
MIDIETGISPIECERPTGVFGETVISVGKWVGSIAIKGGEDDSVLHWHIESESPKHIVETQICALESMRDAIEKRIRLLESSLRD